MNKDFLLGFFVCLAVLLVAAAPISQKLENENKIFQELQNVYNTVQPRQYRIFKSSPTLVSLQEREVVLVSSTVTSIATRISGSLYYRELSTR